MTSVLVATSIGCFEYSQDGTSTVEFTGRQVCSLTAGTSGSACLAVVDGNEIWRRNSSRQWALVRKTQTSLVTILTYDNKIYAATPEPSMLRISASGDEERLQGFDRIEGRDQWFAQGPPLHIRALTQTADGKALLAAVHVGGIPRSEDGGVSWKPTIPVMDDVHEVRAHATNPHVVAAATAYGLCTSTDAGRTFTTFAEGLEVTHALAVAVLDDEVLFSVQSDPFADRSQIWRWKLGAAEIEQVRDGLPQWLGGKVDTAQIASDGKRAAVVDGGGSLWLSTSGSTGWVRIATQVPYPLAMLIV